MNQLSVEDRYLHRIAQKAAKSIQARGATDPEFITPALRGLMGSAGAVNFDQVTKTKTVEKLIGDGSVDGLEQAVPFLEDLITKPGVDDAKVAGSRRQQLATLLNSIVKSLSIKSSSPDDLDSTIKRVMLVVARFAYFVPVESSKNKATVPDPPITSSTQEFFRNKISSCLNMVVAGRKNASTIACQVVQSIHDMNENGEYGKFVIEMGEEISGSVDSAFKILKKIQHKEKKSEAGAASIQALKLLYAMTIFQVYNGDADAVSMLDELKICYDKFVSRKKADDADTAEASDILVEILLSFASKQSQLFRRTSEQVFGAFADRVTATGLQSLIAILEAKDTLAGQQEMFENDDEGSDVEMIDPDDDDVEEIDQSGEESEEDLEASDEESDEDGSENEDGDELEEFDAKLAAALGTHRADKDLDACSEKSSDSDMDDDQMEALDEQLAQVFKARSQVTSKKKEKKEARENMINFKNRALDLLEIYVKKSHSSIIATDILLPLLQAVRKSKVQQIANKASNVLREYCKLCKGNSLPAVEDEDRLWDLLKAIHEEATHSGPAFHATACSQASLLIVRILVAQKKENAKGIVDVYAETRKRQLLSKRCHVQPSFFSDWNNWCVSASKQMKE
ncbi:DNA-directed DNA polymerase [Coccidioides immitis]|nr:DNA-directed DNA polymerase [Coccidioides immitis]